MVSSIQEDGTRIKHEYPEHVKPFSHSCVLNDLKNQTSFILFSLFGMLVQSTLRLSS